MNPGKYFKKNELLRFKDYAYKVNTCTKMKPRPHIFRLRIRENNSLGTVTPSTPDYCWQQYSQLGFSA